MAYRISLALAVLSLVLAATGLGAVALLWNQYVDDPSTDALTAETVLWLMVFLVGPMLLPLAMWPWRTWAVRLLIPILAVVYCWWVLIWSTSLIGIPFLPAGAVLLAASIVRAFAWTPSPNDRVLTQREILGGSNSSG
jgi:hypothetical protein